MGISVLLDASLANLSASSLPVVPTWAFVHLNLVVQPPASHLVLCVCGLCEIVCVVNVSVICVCCVFVCVCVVSVVLCDVCVVCVWCVWCVCVCV